MKDKDITVLLKKADELKALFVLGQRVIPFLEEIFMFVSEIKPLLDEINVSIEDNLRKMPSASKQLSKVTEATELATTEIMDIVDGLFYKSDIITSNLKQICELEEKRLKNPIKLFEIIEKGIKNNSNLTPILPQLAQMLKHLKLLNRKDTDKLVGETNDILNSIREDSSSIMMSLQVQDITSQQIAAVNHLLNAVQQKLAKILQHFQNTDMSGLVEGDDLIKDRTNVSKLHRDIAFDPEAVESLSANSKESRQKEIDEYMRLHKEQASLAEPATQDDIDSMFNANSTNEITDDDEINEVDEEFNNALQEADSLEQISQDDIDALFGK